MNQRFPFRQSIMVGACGSLWTLELLVLECGCGDSTGLTYPEKLPSHFFPVC
jgi:hypothetical protein